MIESKIRRAIRNPRVLFPVFIFGSFVPLGLGMLVMFLFHRFAPDERFWHVLGLILAFPLFLSSLVANAAGLIVLARHILQAFGVETFPALGRPRA